MSVMLDDLYDSLEQETGAPFQITNPEQAIWALRKIARLEAQRAEVKQTAANEIARIVKWSVGMEEKIDKDRAYFDGLLEVYMERQREANPNLKTITLPNGKLTVRRQQPAYTYSEEMLIPWAKANLPDAVKVEESIKKDAVKKYVKETGEVVPGVTITPQPDRFHVEIVPD